MYIHGFMYRHSMTYYTSLLLFHFNNRQSQVEVNIYIYVHFYAHPSWSSSSSYKMYDAFCGSYQKNYIY